MKKKQTEVIGLIATIQQLNPSEEQTQLMNEVALMDISDIPRFDTKKLLNYF